MRWITVVLFLTALMITCAEPEPKKYKPDTKNKEKEKTTILLTEEERKFLREVEEKFGIKNKVPIDNIRNDDDSDGPEAKVAETKTTESKSTDAKTLDDKELEKKVPFPAVIAIEIVNDTETGTKGKGSKRTIDANLGYGYKTNNGYTYTYFGKTPEKGKFMIYPYSQEDIPPPKPDLKPESHSTSSDSDKISSHQETVRTQVEITPSQAYELVPVHQTNEEEQTAYHYEKPAVQFNAHYQNVQSVESPPPPKHAETPTTLYTTYNGHQFSGLTGQFPTVMQNYFVDPSQLLRTPQYQSAGLTHDHLQSHGAQIQQGVVPVLVLRIPSSYLKNPTAELYANVHQNPEIAQYLGHVNLQELVNKYFRKFGYHQTPQVMSYHGSHYAVPEEPVSQEPQQHYASPYVQPSHYTHADLHSGVQYSAVQPVMARYPAGYRSHYYVTRGQGAYRQAAQPQYVYRYRYMHQPQVQTQTYYVQPQHSAQAQLQQHHYQMSQAVEQPKAHHAHEAYTHVTYEHQAANQGDTHQSIAYSAQPTTQDYGSSETVTPNYESVDTATSQAELSRLHPEQHPTYSTHYQQETVAIFPRSQSGHRQGVKQQLVQNYAYQKPTPSSHEESSNHGLVLTENFPSKDHTIATVLPVTYKKKPIAEPLQSVSYVTPVSHPLKYHSHYRVMVPQTVFRNPTSEKVSYVNSHSLPVYSTAASSAELEYTVGSHFVPPIGSQKPPLYPRNYHAHPKRMIKSESKPDTVTMLVKKTEKKSS